MAIDDFKTGKDYYEKLGIGVKAATEEWLNEHNIVASIVESSVVNGTKIVYVDVEGDVWLEGFNLDDVANIPKFIKFRHVTGKFVLTNKK